MSLPSYPHCYKGQIFILHDEWGSYRCCLQCGYHGPLEAPATQSGQVLTSGVLA